MIEIKTHPELNRIAVKSKTDSSYLLWCVLRDNVQVSNLSSHYSKESAYLTAKSYGLSYSRRNFNRILMQGGGLFWGTDGERLYLRSFKFVYNLLADDTAAANPSPMFVRIRVEKSALKRRAEFYWSWVAMRGEQTIARDTLKDLFGLSHDQQRGYERELGKRLIIKTNYCHIDADLYKHPKNIPAHSYYFLQEKFVDGRIETVNVIAYQLPNTYIARNSTSDVSSTEFAPNRALRVSRTLYRRTTACSYNERCYFNFYDQWEKHMNEHAFIRTYYQGKKRIHRQGQYF